MKIKNINKEINQLMQKGDQQALDKVRYKYLKEIKGLCGQKMVLSYYANLNNPEDIIEDDIKSFISLLDEDQSAGIVILINSGGGDLTTVERIMSYIQAKYHNNIEVIVPQIAMSAATVMALSSKFVRMAGFSCLGPIDPQIRIGTTVASGHAILATLDNAKSDMSQNRNVLYWENELKKFPPATEQITLNGIKLSEEIAMKFLRNVMFENETAPTADALKKALNSSDILVHSRKMLRDDLKDIIKIKNLEADMSLYHAVINYHHAISITFERAPHVTKIIETAEAQSMVRARQNVQPAQGQPQPPMSQQPAMPANNQGQNNFPQNPSYNPAPKVMPNPNSGNLKPPRPSI